MHLMPRHCICTQELPTIMYESMQYSAAICVRPKACDTRSYGLEAPFSFIGYSKQYSARELYSIAV